MWYGVGGIRMGYGVGGGGHWVLPPSSCVPYTHTDGQTDEHIQRVYKYCDSLHVFIFCFL